MPAVTMADLTDGTRIRHIEWELSGTIRVLDGVTEIQWDAWEAAGYHEGGWEISPEGPIFPSDVEIIREGPS